MSAVIYSSKPDGTLVELREAPYELEEIFQEQLAQYPGLIPSDQINPDNPPRFLLVTREAGIGDCEGGGCRWSIDHLFVDQNAIPTLVEVKRASDTRARREVIGQLIEYATNAMVHWNAELLAARYELNCQHDGKNPDGTLLGFLGEASYPDGFWKEVEDNLRLGNMRLLFVADEIKPEFHRMVEFLGRFMEKIEVLAVEIKRFKGEDTETLVSRVLGQVAIKEPSKARGSYPQRQWDEITFFEALAGNHPDVVPVARHILNWAKENGLGIQWGRGSTVGAFNLRTPESEKIDMFSVRSDGAIELYLDSMSAPYDTLEKRQELVNELNALTPEIQITKASGYPKIAVSHLKPDVILQGFLRLFYSSNA